MKPSTDELAKIWSLSYSRASLLEAVEFINALETNPAASAQIVRAFSCSIVVSYARPFTKSQVTREKRVIPLHGVEPPAELVATHIMTLKLRDKVVGHKDAIPAKGDLATPNIVLFTRDAYGFDLHTVIVEGIAPELLAKLRALCAFFLEHCEAQLRPLLGRYASEIIKQPPGLYELVIDEHSDRWIRPHNVA